MFHFLTLLAKWNFEDLQAIIDPGLHSYMAVFTSNKDLEWSASIDEAMVTVSANKWKIMFDNVAVTVQQGDILADHLLDKRADGRSSWYLPGQNVSS